jgi:hypothetical protein
VHSRSSIIIVIIVVIIVISGVETNFQLDTHLRARFRPRRDVTRA